MKTTNPKATVLFCFLVAGVWAGSIITYTVIAQNKDRGGTAEYLVADISATSFADHQTALGDRFRDRRDKRGKREEDTTPYKEETAPPLGSEQAPTGDPAKDFEFKFAQALAKESAPVVDPPAAVETEPEGQITGILSAITRLINGEGNFQDIIKIAITAFALFGGGQTLGSDKIFQVILGLFSKKANFNAILQDKLKQTGGGRVRRRAAK